MYTRFVTPERDRNSLQMEGLFVVAYRLIRDEPYRLTAYELAELDLILEWFAEHLGVPDRTHRRAIYWFKPSATEALRHMHWLAHFVRSQGTPVHVVRSYRAGRVIDEDPDQVVAIPWRDTFTSAGRKPPIR